MQTTVWASWARTSTLSVCSTSNSRRRWTGLEGSCRRLRVSVPFVRAILLNIHGWAPTVGAFAVIFVVLICVVLRVLEDAHQSRVKRKTDVLYRFPMAPALLLLHTIRSPSRLWPLSYNLVSTLLRRLSQSQYHHRCRSSCPLFLGSLPATSQRTCLRR